MLLFQGTVTPTHYAVVHDTPNVCGLHVVVGVSSAVFGVITDCVRGLISLHPHQ